MTGCTNGSLVYKLSIFNKSVPQTFDCKIAHSATVTQLTATKTFLPLGFEKISIIQSATPDRNNMQMSSGHLGSVSMYQR